MDVCLVVATPDRPLLFVQQPVESLYAATILQRRGHRVQIADSRVTEVSEVITTSPELFVVVTQTYDLTQCNSLSLENARRLVSELRQRHPGVPVVAAGMHASLEPQMTRRDLSVDASLPGEIEVSLPWLVDRLAEEPRALSGPLDGAPREADPAELPVPDYELIDVQQYWGEIIDSDGRLTNGRTGLIFANRGCPYECRYCFVWFGAKIRRREPAQVVAELRAQAERGVRNFFFLDYTFTIVPGWVRELCGLIRDSGLDISWICQTRVERVTPELLADMRSAGCRGIFYGVESPWIADLDLEKPSSREVIEQAILDTNAAGIKALVFILFGTEYGDPDKARELYHFLRDLPAVFHPSRLLPRPFTGLWNQQTAGMEKPTSWAEYADRAEALQRQLTEMDKLEEEFQRILTLPNYVENQLARDRS